ncbi:hypothetical protein SAMN02910456_00362 [Ruminococcaceae bacterium YRB3002]|nr:hypothetical protein SAMN02910456_00362 [Ruminococcaceae bacterium YRB3002]
MELKGLYCPSCAYAITQADIAYGNCPCCGTDITAIGGEHLRDERNADGTVDIKEEGGRIIGSAVLPRGATTKVSYIFDHSDKVTPKRLRIDLAVPGNRTMFYESGTVYCQIKSGIFNDAKGEMALDLNAKRRNFMDASSFLDKMADQITGAAGRIGVERTSPFPIADMDALRNIFLNASVLDLNKAMNENHGTRFKLDDFFCDGLVKVYTYSYGGSYKYLTLGTIIKGDEVSMSLSTAANLADSLETARDVTGKITQITNASHGFVGGVARTGARMLGLGAVCAIPGAISSVNRFINQSGIITLLNEVKENEKTDDDVSVLTPDAADGSNEGFGEHRNSAKISYISWGYELLVGMISDNRPDARDMDEFETFVKTLKCNEAL